MKKVEHIVKTVEPESIAQEMEIEPGDVVLKINGQDTPIILIKVKGKWRIERFLFPII